MAASPPSPPSSPAHGAPNARESAKQETREALIDAAAAEFAERGLDAPSLDAICARAGFTRGAFYVHFRDREELVAAVMERVLGAFLDGVVARGEGDRDLETTVNRFAAAIAALSGHGATASAPQATQAVGGVPFHQVLAACRRAPGIRERLVSTLEEAIRRVADAAEGEVADDPRDVATLLVITALGARVALDLELPIDVDRVRDAALRLLARSRD